MMTLARKATARCTQRLHALIERALTERKDAERASSARSSMHE